MAEECTFWGRSGSSVSMHGLPGSRLTVAADVCHLRTLLGGLYEFRRPDVVRVVFAQYRNIYLWRTVVMFIDTHGEAMGLYFMPWEWDRLRLALIELGWPVVMERRGLFSVKVIPELGLAPNQGQGH
jgi:hypothetical protein